MTGTDFGGWDSSHPCVPVLFRYLDRPMSYYKVTASRMLLDFCTHLLVLALFTTVALLDHQLGVSAAKMVLISYSMVSEVRSKTACAGC